MVIVVCVLIGCVSALGAVWMLRPPAGLTEEQVEARRFTSGEVDQLAEAFGARFFTAPPSVPSVLDARLLEQVIVTLKSGSTFAGVLYVEDSGAVVLCNATKVGPTGQRTPADGEIILLRADIDFIQRP